MATQLRRRIQIGGRPFDIPVGPPGGGMQPYRLFRVPGGVVPARRGLGALGGSTERQNQIPMPDGTEGSPVWPYNEQGTPWGVGGASDTLPPMPADIGSIPPLVPQTQPGFLPTTVPYGRTDPQAKVAWRNPTTAAIVPILAGTAANQPVLSLNYQRNLLIVQNNSTATAPDTTPIFFIGFNTPVPAPGFGLALAAGIGIVFDIITPRDSVYILQAGGGGATLIVAGVVVQGTFAPN
jgi:hypothetical protein